MPTTTNFGWTTPADTDLVKDGALAIRTLGNGIDTSLVDLKGGTTGQVLSKASNTDMDFTWVAQDDSNAIQNEIVDAKGDLISATAADTPARLAVGTNGQVLTVDSTTATGLKWATPAGGGGKVLQVVSSVTTTSTAINGTTLTDTTISATITPSSTSSKILVLVTGNYYVDTDNATASGIKMALLRGSTTIWDGGNNTHYYNVLTAVKMQMNLNYLDSPSTTSATTYKIQSAEQVAANHTMVWQEGSQPSIITLLEIGA